MFSDMALFRNTSHMGETQRLKIDREETLTKKERQRKGRERNMERKNKR